MTGEKAEILQIACAYGRLRHAFKALYFNAQSYNESSFTDLSFYRTVT